jgi:putative ABC transport system permease protein
MAWHRSASVAVGGGAAPQGGGAVLMATGITIGVVLACIGLLVAFGPWPADPSSGAMRVLAITPGSQRALTPADADALGNSISGATLLSRVVFGTASVSSGNHAQQLGIQAVDPPYANLPEASLAQGTFFTPEDALGANRVAVLGPAAATSLLGTAESPIGQTILIRDVPYTVIGVLSSRASSASATDASVLIPYQTGRVRLFGLTDLGEALLQVRDPSQTDAITQGVQQLLRTRHQVRPGQPDGFTIRTPTPAGASASGPAVQFVNRLVYVSRQAACQAKALCVPTAQTFSSPT